MSSETEKSTKKSKGKVKKFTAFFEGLGSKRDPNKRLSQSSTNVTTVEKPRRQSSLTTSGLFHKKSKTPKKNASEEAKTLYSRMDSSANLPLQEQQTEKNAQNNTTVQKEQPVFYSSMEDSKPSSQALVPPDEPKKSTVPNLYLVEDNKPNLYMLQDPNVEPIEATQEVPAHYMEPSESGIPDWSGTMIGAMEEARKNNKMPDLNYLSGLGARFKDTATLYAKIIISELGLPNELKTIKPTNVGGVAGGEKYVYHNILFKLALDVPVMQNPVYWMYGGASGPSDVHAMKSAKNELKGMQCFGATHLPGLSYPPMAVIDYKGYRMIAVGLLPINKDTLKYGSGDSGKTVHDDPHAAALMQEVAKRLNLKGHITGQAPNKKMIYGPGDIEVHQGMDGRWYILDYGRLMPPEDPRVRNEENKRGVFYNLLRVEYVKMNPVPLCSDAFTNWNNDDDLQVRIQNNQEVVDATKRLYEVVIPEFAEHLDKLEPTVRWDRLFGDDTPKREVREIIDSILGRIQIHERGINLRQLGYLRTKVKSEQIRKLLLCMCIARYIKDDLRSRMRDTMKNVKVPSDEPFRGLVIQYFNTILGHDTKGSLAFWEDEIRHGLKQKYIDCLSPTENQTAFDLKSYVSLRVIFIILLNLTGIVLKPTARKDMLKSISTFKFVETDIKSLDAESTPFNLVHFAEGMSLAEEAKKLDDSSDEKRRLMQVAQGRLLVAHEASPICAKILTYLGNITRGLALLTPDQTEKEKHLASAEKYLGKAIQYFQYSTALDSYAQCLREHAQMKNDLMERSVLLNKAQEVATQTPMQNYS